MESSVMIQLGISSNNPYHSPNHINRIESKEEDVFVFKFCQ